jgi:hypothetical protein
MSRQFIDDDLITWEVHSSTGRFSLPQDGRLVFLCVTDPERRPRTTRIEGDLVDAEVVLAEAGDSRLRQLLAESRELS